MKHPVRFRVPASTSNLGAGFDALSLALAIHVRVTVRVSDLPTDSVESSGVSTGSIPADGSNLIVRVAHRVAARRGRTLPSLHLMIDNDIPLARGLGSSAAAIIAGVTCYEAAADDALTPPEILGYALEFEPHPDNLAAALHGGLAVAASGAGFPSVIPLKVTNAVQPVVVVPAFELSTEEARRVLPASYSRKDAVFNIQRAALVVAALTTGRLDMLRTAMRDRIHQPYREPLVPGLGEILDLEMDGLYGTALSGAGPTVLALCGKTEAAAVGRRIADIFASHGIQSTPLAVAVDYDGRTIEDQVESL